MVAGLRSARLDITLHGVDEFTCGEDELDDWLRSVAHNSGRMGASSTFVLAGRDGRVLGYYCLSAHLVMRDDLPGSLAKKGPEVIPAYLLGKLAVDVTVQSRGVGSILLADAFLRCLLASADGPAARVIVLEALNSDAARFYERFGFVQQRNSTTKYAVKLSTVARYVEEAGLLASDS